MTDHNITGTVIGVSTIVFEWFAGFISRIFYFVEAPPTRVDAALTLYFTWRVFKSFVRVIDKHFDRINERLEYISMRLESLHRKP